MSRNTKTNQLKSKTKTGLSRETTLRKEATVSPAKTRIISKEGTNIRPSRIKTIEAAKSVKILSANKNENDQDRLKPKTSTSTRLKTKTIKPVNESNKSEQVLQRTITSTDTKTVGTVSNREKQHRITKPSASSPSTTTIKKSPISSLVKSPKLSASKTEPKTFHAKPSSTFPETVGGTGTSSAKVIKKSASKPNAVLDTYHNVTITSPPTKRRSEGLAEQEQEYARRSGTSTLCHEKVVILKSESAKCRSEQKLLEDIKYDSNEDQRQLQVKDPIAFEIKFQSAEGKLKSDLIEGVSEGTEVIDSVRTSTPTNAQRIISENHSDEDYTDDFESYESDFESGSSIPGSSERSSDGSSSSSTTNTKSSEEDRSKSVQEALTISEGKDKMEIIEKSELEESTLTPFPVTVTQRDKERTERVLDSGTYEVTNMAEQQILLPERLPFSRPVAYDESLIASSTVDSGQLDSGVSSYGHNTLQMHRNEHQMSEYAISYGGFVHFNTRPARTERGMELMSKIQFDVLSFILFDMKPITYDVFMQTFGRLNTRQSFAQTERSTCVSESQTDYYEMRSMWTQHPPLYDLQTVQSAFECGRVGAAMQNCCGELPLERVAAEPRDQFDVSLQKLKRLHIDKSSRILNKQLGIPRKPLYDCVRLHQFLLRSALQMSRVLNANNAIEGRFKAISHEYPLAKVSAGYRQIDVNFLNALRVVYVFANVDQNLLITVHTCLADPDLYSSEFTNLIMVWSTTDTTDKPLRLLSSWGDVCCAEIYQGAKDVVVCGLKDGTIALWDLQETYSFCSKLDGYLTHFAATQSVKPVWNDVPHIRDTDDTGPVVDVKKFRSSSNNLQRPSNILNEYKPLQFITLHDIGILTIWTLVESGSPSELLNITSPRKRRTENSKSIKSAYEITSPWARIKLIQSAICDLRDSLERRTLKTQNNFEWTKSLFEKNIYSDAVLRELKRRQAKISPESAEGLRFSSMSVGCERIYICTSSNFILACSKSLKLARFEKVCINESPYIFSTCLRVLSNENFLAVGLSNGSVIILDCNRNRRNNKILLTHRNEGEKNENKDKLLLNRPFSPDLEIGKSCAIQNIILNERRNFRDITDMRNESSSSNYVNIHPSTVGSGPYLELINEQSKPFELRVYDRQILLSGSMLRKNLIHSLELSSDGWKLFALFDGQVRVYDFFLDREVTDIAIVPNCADDVLKVCNIAVAKSSKNEQHLVLLTGDNNVHLHLLK